MTLLSVEGLSVCYETGRGYMNAVEHVSFSLENGRSLGFVGESGCGKTTLGMALMRLLPANGKITEGKISFNGEDLLRKSEEEMRRLRWKEMAMIFQAAMNALNPVQRVQDQIVEAITTHYPEMEKRAAIERVAELFRLVGLPEDRMRDYPHQYSGGMKQRAIIAMALSCNPKLIIADEPTTALDVIVQHQILERTKSIQKDLGFGIIFISHDISVVAEVCDDIGIMYAGQLVEFGPKEEVFAAPRHPYTIALFSSFPTLNEKKSLRPIPGETPNLIDPPSGCRFCDRCPGAQSACSMHCPCWVEVSDLHRVMCSCCSPSSASPGRG
ncbi:MAG: ABC transporter ATP-binding protein [Desulfobacteraceae bacterium]|nr:MAG: ABC transporter ATP-binding protein [Desulfobacteraceae bacterium]